MWPFLKRKKIDVKAFEECVKDVIERIETSEDSIWEGLSGDEICMDLKIAQENLKEEKEIDKNHVLLLFAPTGPIQEISIDNGWGEEFLTLADKIEQILKQ